MLMDRLPALKMERMNMSVKSGILYRLSRVSWSGNLRFAVNYLEYRGPKAFLRKLLLKIFGYNKADAYRYWIKLNEPKKPVLMMQNKKLFDVMSKIILVTMSREVSDQLFLDKMIRSLVEQTYENWELIVIYSQRQDLLEFEDRRVKSVCCSDITDIDTGLGQLSTLLKGDFVGFVPATHIFAPFALYEIVLTVNKIPDVDCLYSDHDILEVDRALRSIPYFKPDWSPDLLGSCNYVGYFFLIEKALLNRIGGLNGCKHNINSYDLLLRATEKARQIVHIPKILYHVQSGTEHRTYDECSLMSAEEHLRRVGVKGIVQEGLLPGTHKVMYSFNHKTKISIIIPNTDHHLDLQKCVQSVITMSTYTNYEICVVENGSIERQTFDLYEKLSKNNMVRIMEWKTPFNYSAINNFAVNIADGEVILFLNNDTEVINPDWLERMLEHALRRDIGAVGAKLYYPDGTIQHAGVVVSIGGVADHAFKGFEMGSSGYFGNLKTIRNVSAVTAACLMTRREVFNEVAGFDESLVVAYNDIDFCLRLRVKGYLILWTPFAELYHYEYKTRKYPSSSAEKNRERRERKLFQKKWRHVLKKSDPYYNPNLKYEKADFSTGMA
jgi:GT2 family glycosyltransferase